MKKFLSFISIFLLLSLSGNAYSGPICEGPIGGSGQDPGNVVITGGTIDGTVIGGTTPAAGSFTTLEASTDPVDADGVGDRGYNDLRYLGIIPSIFKLDHNVELLNAHRTILITDKPIQWFDPNGSDRNVTLPAEASSTDLVFTIYNDSDGAGEDLVIRDDTPTTLITIGPGQGAKVSCDGTSWKVLNAKGIYCDEINDHKKISGYIELEDTTSSTTGIIFKNADKFIHNFHHPTGNTAVPDGHNTFVGINAGNFLMGSTATELFHGSWNTAVGEDALKSNTLGWHNVAIGMRSLEENTTGYYNTAVGFEALEDTTTGYYNTAVGTRALNCNSIGIYNTAMGESALSTNSQGYQNVALGTEALRTNTIGYYNTAVGAAALRMSGSGNGNTAVGMGATRNSVTGGNNTTIGCEAGWGASANSYSNNTFVGYRVGYNASTGSNNTIIGCNINLPAATTSNYVNLGGIIRGDLSKLETEIIGYAVLNDTTFSFTTEADITDPLPTSVILLSGDNDSENDTIDLQDGETAGQILYLIASANIDADDTCTISYGDTTCTNCPTTVFDKVGENVHLIWIGSTWVVISLMDAL